MATNKKRFNILNKAEYLADYVLQALNKSPKKLRSDIIPEIRLSVIKIIRLITEANLYHLDNSNERLLRSQCQFQTILELNCLDSFCSIAVKHTYLTDKQYEIISATAQELQDMIYNWQASDLKR